MKQRWEYRSDYINGTSEQKLIRGLNRLGSAGWELVRASAVYDDKTSKRCGHQVLMKRGTQPAR